VQLFAAVATFARLLVSGTDARIHTLPFDCAIILPVPFTRSYDIPAQLNAPRNSKSMSLETSRLTLRPFVANDLERMSELFANEHFMRFSMGPLTSEQSAAFLEKVLGWNCAGLPSQFAVIDRATGMLIGYCGFIHQEVDGEKEVEIGYRLHPDFWNRGLATEAARAVRDHAFRDLQLKRVISLIHPQNHPSRRVTEKNGMTIEKETTFRGFPTFVFSITRARWEQMQRETDLNSGAVR
jgi:ribosomal-protein-alanine N-acetyltransferase